MAILCDAHAREGRDKLKQDREEYEQRKKLFVESNAKKMKNVTNKQEKMMNKGHYLVLKTKKTQELKLMTKVHHLVQKKLVMK